MQLGLATLAELQLVRDDGTKRIRRALETIEGIGQAVDADGIVVRSAAAPHDEAGRRCLSCRRYPAKPMPPTDARDARSAVVRAGLDDAIAYAFARTTILVTASSRLRTCVCDLHAWKTALEEYRRDPSAAWRSMGVEP
jgi:hypothetical protein